MQKTKEINNKGAMKKILILNISTLAAMLIYFSASAQDKPKQTFGEEVIVGQAYKPQLTDAVKIDVNPVPDAPDTAKPRMTYSTQSALLPVEPLKSKLKAPSLKMPLDELHHNFVKAGIGNYSNIYLEYFYNSLRSKEHLFTAHALHHSGSGSVKGGKFGQSLLDLNGKKIIGKIALQANAGFEQQVYHYYGLVPDTIFSDLNPRQRFMDVHLGGGFENAIADADKVHFGGGINFYNFSDRYKTKESDIGLSANFTNPIGDNRLLLKGDFDFIHYDFEGKSNNRTLLKILAQYRFVTNGFRVNAGFKTASESDSIGGKFHFYPDIQLEADLAGKFLTVFGSITGNLDKNTYRDMAYENPFIKSGSEIRNANEKFELSGGLKGSLTDHLTYRTGLAYKNYSNLYFYVNDSSDARKFVPIYDSATTTVLNFNFEAGYKLLENFNLNTSFNYNYYTVSSAMRHAYQRPGMEWMLTGIYNIDDKIILNGDLFVIGSRYATVLGSSKDVKLKSIADLNVGMTYVFTNLKGLQAFIQAQNLMATKYNIWNYYPNRGFQIIGGIKLSFL